MSFFPNLTYFTTLALQPNCNYIAGLQGFHFFELVYWQMKRESVIAPHWWRRFSPSEAAILISYHERKLGEWKFVRSIITFLIVWVNRAANLIHTVQCIPAWKRIAIYCFVSQSKKRCTWRWKLQNKNVAVLNNSRKKCFWSNVSNTTDRVSPGYRNIEKRIENATRIVGDETLSRVFDISSQSKQNPRSKRRSKIIRQNLC